MRLIGVFAVAGTMFLASGSIRARPTAAKPARAFTTVIQGGKTAGMPAMFVSKERACVIVRGSNLRGIVLKVYQASGEKRRLVAQDQALAQGDGAFACVVWYPPPSSQGQVPYAIEVTNVEEEPRHFYIALK